MPAAHKKLIAELQSFHERDLLGHSYIFFGAPRIGKKEAALDLATRLETGSKNEKSSKSVSQKPLTDTQVFAPDDKGVIGIDTAREIKSFLFQRPFIGPRRVAIVDKSQALTPHAQNALLKVAEEPPQTALLILVMTDPELLWPTLQSRFQKIYFPAPPVAEMRAALATAAAENPLTERFFTVPPAGRKDFVKELTAAEDFNFTAFLDSLISYMTARHGETKTAKNPAAENDKLWHAVLELRRLQDATGLNPRIQLMNLWTLI